MLASTTSYEIIELNDMGRRRTRKGGNRLLKFFGRTQRQPEQFSKPTDLRKDVQVLEELNNDTIIPSIDQLKLQVNAMVPSIEHLKRQVNSLTHIVRNLQPKSPAAMPYFAPKI
jgi:hypothetical protein